MFLFFLGIKVDFGRCMLKLAELVLDIFDVHFNFMNASIKVATFSFVLKKDAGFYKRLFLRNELVSQYQNFAILEALLWNQSK